MLLPLWLASHSSLNFPEFCWFTLWDNGENSVGCAACMGAEPKSVAAVFEFGAVYVRGMLPLPYPLSRYACEGGGICWIAELGLPSMAAIAK